MSSRTYAPSTTVDRPASSMETKVNKKHCQGPWLVYTLVSYGLNAVCVHTTSARYHGYGAYFTLLWHNVCTTTEKAGSAYQDRQLVTQCQWISILAVYLDLLHLNTYKYNRGCHRFAQYRHLRHCSVGPSSPLLHARSAVSMAILTAQCVLAFLAARARD